ncbi:YgaP family membrane protein [Marinomonas colpomeniae]|uniref:DUF2892 domain-containing protein n=1 Tax=Marinomonas colpomeniae TaxID=2774408 RepID=A0ABR8NTZ3_9GAMM|nr:DUF2892 domain-containing protein [Marinomonas colpomeniae]MBD5769515.1 DUF2892 domain-containing protein [Marinomonas colpomeniae]
MEKNLHPLDRILRGIIGVSVIGFVLFNDGYLEEPVLEILLIIFGALNLISLISSWCPIYQIAGISTCKAKK